MNSSKFCQGTEVPHSRKNSSELWISMTKWSHLLNLRYTHGCFHMCIYLNYFIIKQKGKKENFKDQCNKNCSAQRLAVGKHPLSHLYPDLLFYGFSWGRCERRSVRFRYVPDGKTKDLFPSKSNLVGQLSLSELPKGYGWPKGSGVTHHNKG